MVLGGLWLVVMGVMLWTPEFLPKGCFVMSEVGRDVVRCHGDRALDRAKGLVNVEFGLYLSALTVVVMVFYLVVVVMYPQEKVEYRSLRRFDVEEKGDYEVGTQT